MKSYRGVAKELAQERTKRVADRDKEESKKLKLEKENAEKTPEQALEGKIVKILSGVKAKPKASSRPKMACPRGQPRGRVHTRPRRRARAMAFRSQRAKAKVHA